MGCGRVKGVGDVGKVGGNSEPARKSHALLYSARLSHQKWQR